MFCVSVFSFSVLMKNPWFRAVWKTSLPQASMEGRAFAPKLQAFPFVFAHSAHSGQGPASSDRAL
jgi:hypothetical protein